MGGKGDLLCCTTSLRKWSIDPKIWSSANTVAQDHFQKNACAVCFLRLWQISSDKRKACSLCGNTQRVCRMQFWNTPLADDGWGVMAHHKDTHRTVDVQAAMDVNTTVAALIFFCVCFDCFRSNPPVIRNRQTPVDDLVSWRVVQELVIIGHAAVCPSWWHSVNDL